jgi:diguanylate cyclase (GGDEF)-like protein
VPLLGVLLATATRDAARPGERISGTGGGDDWPHLCDTIERELARARRERSSCAVLLVALAPVETTQATPEHSGPALDEDGRQAMLRLLRATCRAMDMVSRYGADQFLALLPGSDGRGARLAADRFLRQLYLSPVGLPPDRSRYLHATIGIAAFPVDGFTADELLSTASTALFEQRRAVGGRQ